MSDRGQSPPIPSSLPMRKRMLLIHRLTDLAVVCLLQAVQDVYSVFGIAAVGQA